MRKAGFRIVTEVFAGLKTDRPTDRPCVP